MKVLHINSSDSSGGAARACLDISNALNKSGINSRVLVQTKHSDQKEVQSINVNLYDRLITRIRRTLDYLIIKLLTVEKRGRFTIPYTGKDITKLKAVKDADIINFHWVNEGFLSLKSLEQIAGLGKPLVWTLHDMWAFTGGCHYSLGCRKFETECLECPSLKFSSKNDFSNKIFRNKIRLFKEQDFNIVTCSNWLSEEVKKSSLLKNANIRVIPNTLKTDIYKPLDKTAVLKELNLDENKKYILFGTMSLKDERKGLDLFMKCVDVLCEKSSSFADNTQLIIAGSEKNISGMHLPVETKFLGRLNSEKDIAKFYNAGCLFVAPSREDNLPNTVMESLSCGTPVAAFNIGGMSDMIDHKINGYLAEPFNIEDLADGINWILTHPDPLKLTDNSRSKIINNFTYQKIAETYSGYYDSLIGR